MPSPLPILSALLVISLAHCISATGAPDEEHLLVAGQYGLVLLTNPRGYETALQDCLHLFVVSEATGLASIASLKQRWTSLAQAEVLTLKSMLSTVGHLLVWGYDSMQPCMALDLTSGISMQQPCSMMLPAVCMRQHAANHHRKSSTQVMSRHVAALSKRGTATASSSRTAADRQTAGTEAFTSMLSLSSAGICVSSMLLLSLAAAGCLFWRRQGQHGSDGTAFSSMQALNNASSHAQTGSVNVSPTSATAGATSGKETIRMQATGAVKQAAVAKKPKDGMDGRPVEVHAHGGAGGKNAGSPSAGFLPSTHQWAVLDKGKYSDSRPPSAPQQRLSPVSNARTSNSSFLPAAHSAKPSLDIGGSAKPSMDSQRTFVGGFSFSTVCSAFNRTGRASSVDSEHHRLSYV